LLEPEDVEARSSDLLVGIDPTEDIYIKTLSSFKFLINFEELTFRKKRDLIVKASASSHWRSLL